MMRYFAACWFGYAFATVVWHLANNRGALTTNQWAQAIFGGVLCGAVLTWYRRRSS